jgi:dihydrofolate reductase
VAYIEMVHVKPGNSEKFETTLKRHWGWHEKQGETWSYLVWTVDTGKNDGAYEIVSFGHTWKEVDESNALVAGTPPPEEDPEPYQQTVQESYYRYRPDLSIGSSVKQPSPVASVTQILLMPEAAQDFEVELFAINTTLDGCVDHAKQFADDETHEYFTDLMREGDLLVFGRITYELMVPFWPEVAKNQSMSKASNEFARTFDSINKIVFSRSLNSVEDKNTRIVRTNLHDEILKLKQEQGTNILVGGVSIPSQLIKLGLVDEYRFVIGPIVAGEGRRLLEGVSLPERLQLKLVESKIFKSGCVALRYLKP